MMNKKSKLVSMLLLAAIFIMTMGSAPAAAADLPETVLYENDFTGTTLQEAFPSFSNEYMSIGGMDADENHIEGNYPDLHPDGYIYFQNVTAWKTGRTILADFTKGGAKSGLSDGKIKVSYDFKTRQSTADPNMAGINMNDEKGTYEGYVIFGIVKNDSVPTLVVKNTPGYYDVALSSGPNVALTSEKWYHLDMIIDLDVQTLAVYLDGTLVLGDIRAEGIAPMNNFAISMNGFDAGLDNLKISQLNNTSYEFRAEAEYANGYVDLVFPAAMNPAKGSFTVDGQDAQAKWLSLNKVRLTADTLEKPGEHTVSAQGMEDFFGTAPLNTSVTFITDVLGPEEILYENDFANGTDSVDWDNWKDYGAFYGLTKKYSSNPVNQPITAEFEGNKGIRGAGGQWPTATQFCFDFTKDGTLPAVNSGVYKISYDFSIDGSVTSCDTNMVGLNMKDFWDGVSLMEYRIGKFYILIGGAGETGEQDVDPNQVYTIDVILDFDADTVDFYLNGAHKYQRTWFGVEMERFHINFCQCIDFFDNLKVSKLNKGQDYQYGFKTETEDAANGYVDLVFDSVMNTEEGNFTIDGNAVPSENIEWKSTGRVRLYADSLLEEGVHTVEFTNVKDIYGISPEEHTAEFENAAKTYLRIEDNFVKAFVSNSGTQEQELPIVIVTSFDEEGHLTSIKTYRNFTVDGTEVSQLNAGTKAELSVDISTLEGKIKAFMWNSIQELMPLAAAVEK